MKIYKFSGFVENLYEFDKSMHFLDRINIDRNRESHPRKKSGSKLLPLKFTPKLTGYNIDFLRNHEERNENMGYNKWLYEYGITKEDFERFISKVWNHQMDHKKLDDTPQQHKGKAFVILPGEVYIKTSDGKVWEVNFKITDKERKGTTFVMRAIEDQLTTITIEADINKDSLVRDAMDHIRRKQKTSREGSYDAILSNRSVEIKHLKQDPSKDIIVEYTDGGEKDFNNAKNIIDKTYGLFVPKSSEDTFVHVDSGEPIPKGDQQYNMGPGAKLKVYVPFKKDFEEVSVVEILNKDNKEYKKDGIRIKVFVDKDGKKLSLGKTLKVGETVYVPKKGGEGWHKAIITEPGYIVDTRQKEPLNLKYKIKS